jgi:hypothetical protein
MRRFFIMSAIGQFPLTVNPGGDCQPRPPAKGDCPGWILTLPPTSFERKAIRRINGKPRIRCSAVHESGTD